MVIRLVVKTTPGRPILAAAIMAALLALAGAAAWMVTAHKLGQPIHLGQSESLSDLPLKVSVPAGWAGVEVDQARTGLIAVFAEPGSGMLQTRRLMVYYHRIAKPVSPATLISEFYQGWVGPVKLGPPTDVGPLPARQTLVVFRERDDLHKELIRPALIGDGEYLVLQLVCLGPPTDYEYRMMDRVARSVQASPKVYVPPEQLAGQTGIHLAGDAGAWLAWIPSDPTHDLVLLPSGTADGKPAPFWGLVRLTLAPVLPDEDPAEMLARQFAERAAPAMRSPGVSRRPRAPPPRRSPAARPAVEKRAIAGLPAWRVRLVEDDLVRLCYVFRPLAGDDAGPRVRGPDDGGEGGADERGPRSAPADAPPAVVLNRAIILDAWSVLDDETAAAAAIERLIGAVRIP